MKTGLWAVFLYADSMAVGGASLDRELEGTAKTVAGGGILRPVLGVSVHSSASAADRAAARIVETLKPFGWWLAEDSAQNEEKNQEDSESES